MKIPKYWAKNTQTVAAPDGRRYALARWQWSDISAEDAQQQAAAKINELVQKVRANEQLNRYSYGERPLREEISQVLTNRAGQEVAVVTRNLYGALVLNAANAMFIDIDFPDSSGAGSGRSPFQRLLGGKSAGPEQEPLQRIQAWWEQRRDLSLRVYRTFAGLRCLITSHVFDPSLPDTADILSALKSDPLYVRLCKAQGCFRARLTPKPWRCAMGNPPSRYPWDDSAAEIRFRQWERRYEGAIAQYAACKLIQQFGAGERHPDVEPVLELHDRLARTESGLQLA
jgi:hypothetical protein